MADYARRLPVYLLLDCSGSMMGDPIEAVRQGVKALLLDLKGDPQALETAYISVITFDSTARQVVPLTELMQFQEPELQARGATAMGRALEVLMDGINEKAMDSIGDSILDDGFELYDDYREQVKEMVESL